MGERTSIEWTDATWNPIRGTRGTWSCVKVSEGCAHCYAERFNVQRGGPEYKVGADTLRLDEEVLTHPIRWKRPRRIFVCSMTDLFEERVPDEWIRRIFDVMRAASQHQFQVLTKRAERMWVAASNVVLDPGNVFSHPGLAVSVWPRNVVAMVSAETQARATERIPWLLRVPGAVVRGVSVEPLLGPVDLTPFLGDALPWMRDPVKPSPIQWVIVGGESGGPPERALVTGQVNYQAHRLKRQWIPTPQAIQWVEDLRDQCVAAGVPFFFKQWGGPNPKSGGRRLDGKEWSEFP